MKKKAADKTFQDAITQITNEMAKPRLTESVRKELIRLRLTRRPATDEKLKGGKPNRAEPRLAANCERVCARYNR